jgi:hypothetical protein
MKLELELDDDLLDSLIECSNLYGFATVEDYAAMLLTYSVTQDILVTENNKKYFK